MASRFVQTTDFEKGKFALPQNCFQEELLQECIEEQENCVLLDLLGAELSEKFVQDWDDSNPDPNKFSEQRFIDIFEPFQKDNDCRIEKSEGIKKMLMYFIYFEYARQISIQRSTTGALKVKREVSEGISEIKAASYNYYNRGVRNYCSIQWFICDNSGEYAEYNGQTKNLLNWL